MEVIIRSYYGHGSGVVDELIGKPASTLACGEDEQLLIVSELLSCIAQKRDIHVMYYEN